MVSQECGVPGISDAPHPEEIHTEAIKPSPSHINERWQEAFVMCIKSLLWGKLFFIHPLCCRTCLGLLGDFLSRKPP